MSQDDLDALLSNDAEPFTVEDLEKANRNLAGGIEVCIEAMKAAKRELEGGTVRSADRWADAAENALVHLDEALERWGRA